MGNWAELLEVLLVDIAARIPLLEDFFAFGGVCNSWRSVATKQNFKGSQQVPWLMLSEEEEGAVTCTGERRFVSLTKGGMVLRYTLPEAKGKRIFESLGWFVTLSEDGEMSLLHPFSQVQILLPPIHAFEHYETNRMAFNTIFIKKAVLSSSPDPFDNKDFVVMVIFGRSSLLGFWRPGDKTWTTIETPTGAFVDVNSCNGKFYGVDARGRIFCCDINGGPNETVAQVVGGIPREFVMFKRSYVVECETDLMIVVRGVCELHFLGDYGSDPNIDYETKDFRLFVVDLKNGGECTEKKSLGNNSLFLGDNASITVQASKFPGINANCIYYTDDSWDLYTSFKRGGGKDMGIYNLEDGSWLPHYKRESFSRVCPPIWVNPSL